MADDLGLLLDAILQEGSAGDQPVVIAAERVAGQGQENALLVLPNMHHFVDEQSLQCRRAVAEVFAE